jgi:branched-chain amino acid transport system permease protein
MTNRLSSRALQAALLAALVAIPAVTGNFYYLHVATMIGVYWILIAGLTLLVGFTGVFSIGHVGLLAIGAYTLAICGDSFGWPPLLAMLLGSALCGLVGLLLGLPSLRLPGFYFAMLTLAFGMIVTELALAETWLTHGSVGFPAPNLPWPLDGHYGLYGLVTAVALGVTGMTWSIARSMWGRSLRAVREAEVAATAVGISVYRVKLTVFVFSGACAGLAGGLFAEAQSYITPDSFTVDLGMFFFVSIIIGGPGRLLGPFMGAAVLTAIPELVAPLAKYGTFFYGAILLLVVLLTPSGLGEFIERLLGSRRKAEPMLPMQPDLEKLRLALELGCR